MSNSNRSQPDRKPQLPATISQPGNLLDAALAYLPPEQQKALAMKALERKLEIDAQAAEADGRHRAASADMDQTINFIRDMESATKSDYTVSRDFRGAAGTTNVQIKKSNNTVIIVIAVVVAIIVLMMFSK
ncbi:MAG: hypothetical protein JNM99_17950 [Verrucomicrobiaceae bacterium]|nr:hypothetical protein [Verrucomicrobiaceae bacterium]